MDEGVSVTDQDKFFGPHSAAEFMGRWERRELTGDEVENLRAMLSVHIEIVEVQPRATRNKTFDPSRVRIKWTRAWVCPPQLSLRVVVVVDVRVEHGEIMCARVFV